MKVVIFRGRIIVPHVQARVAYRDAATETEQWPSAKKPRMETRVSQVKEYLCALIFIVSDICIRDYVSILHVNCGLK